MARLGLVRAVVVVGSLGALASCGSDFTSSSGGSGGVAGELSSGGSATDETGGADSAGASSSSGGSQIVGTGGDGGDGTGGEPASGGSGTGGEPASGGRGLGGEVGSGGSGVGGQPGSGGSGVGGHADSGGSGGEPATGGSGTGGEPASGGTGTGGEPASGGTGTGGDVGSGGTGSGGEPGSGGMGTGGVTGDWGRCEVTSDCVIRPASCCGECGAATRDDIIALNQEELSQYQAVVCENGMACDPCVQPTDPFLVATCGGSHCQVVDLLDSEITECREPSDCKVRVRDCCECNSDMASENLISISRDREAEYSELVCDPDTTCPECAPVYPPEAMPSCVTDSSNRSHCGVIWSTVSGN